MTIDMDFDDTTPIFEPSDILEVAWRRYDEAATRLDRLRLERNGMTYGTEEYNDACDAILLADHMTEDARHERELLKTGACSCADDDPIPCAYCSAYARVRAWENEQVKE